MISRLVTYLTVLYNTLVYDLKTKHFYNDYKESNELSVHELHPLTKCNTYKYCVIKYHSPIMTANVATLTEM